MQDWATFFFTGSGTLPVFMVLANEEAFGLALLVFFGLLVTGCLFGARQEDCPARQASLREMEERMRQRRRR